MEQKVLVILLKKSWWQQHLIYVLDNSIVIDTSYTHLFIYNKNNNIIKNIKKSSYTKKGYKIAGVKKVNRYIKNNTLFLKLFIYNCISIGKILFNKKGIYLSCQSLFNNL